MATQKTISYSVKLPQVGTNVECCLNDSWIAKSVSTTVTPDGSALIVTVLYEYAGGN